jgi:hypothetical protein
MENQSNSENEIKIPVKMLELIKFITEFYYEQEEQDLDTWNFYEQAAKSVDSENPEYVKVADPDFVEDNSKHIFEYIKTVDDFLSNLNIKSSEL